jgi:hypothetical protein
MSNERRYETSNFYQFPTSNKNSLINFSNRLIEEKDAERDSDTLESQKMK